MCRNAWLGSTLVCLLAPLVSAAAEPPAARVAVPVPGGPVAAPGFKL